MIESKCRDDSDFRPDDIGAVEAPAQPRLEDGDIHPLARENRKSHCREQLEDGAIRGGVAPVESIGLDNGSQAGHGLGKGLGGYGDAVEADSLGIIAQMRGCEQAGAASSGAQGRVEHGGNGAFAFRAGNMDTREGVLGIPHAPEEFDKPLEVVIGRSVWARGGLALEIEPGGEIVSRLFVGEG